MCCILNTLLVIYNVAVFLSGVGLIVIGSLLSKLLGENGGDLETFVNTEFHMSMWLIIAGVIIAVIGFLGSCGVICGNRVMLYLYAVILFILAGTQVGLIIYGSVATDSIEEHGREAMLDFFGNFYSDDEILKNATQAIQHEFECCGVDGYTDWLDEIGDDEDKRTIPQACCKSHNTICLQNPDDHHDMLFQEGCYTKITDELKPFFDVLIYGMIGAVIFQVLCIIQSCFVAKRVKQNKNSCCFCI